MYSGFPIQVIYNVLSIIDYRIIYESRFATNVKISQTGKSLAQMVKIRRTVKEKI